MSTSNISSNENEEYFEQSTELSLTWYITILLEAKITIFICGIFLAILSLITYFFLPVSSQADLEVLKTSKIVAIQYDELNRTIKEINEFNKNIASNISELNFSTQTKKNNDEDEDEDISTQTKKNNDEDEDISFKIDRDTLIDSLFEQLLKREPFFQAIRENKILKRGNFVDDETYENAIIENAYQVKLLPPTPIVDGVPIDQRNFRPFWIIERSGRNKDTLRNVIFDALQIATNSVKKDTVIEFNEFMEREKKRRKALNGHIDQLIQLKTSQYEFEMSSHIAKLKEQAELARILDIEKNALEVRSLSANNQILAIENDQNKQELFYRGYRALDFEIKQIEERKNSLDFINDIVPLKTLKFQLKQDKTLEQLQTAFNATPLVKGEFQAANYHKYGIKITKPKTIYMAPIMIFMFGIFSVICILVIRRLIAL